MIVAVGALMLAMSKPPLTSIGPIYEGRSAASVRKLLGAGTPYSTCRPDPKLKPGDCPLALKYGDGTNVLKISFVGNGDGVYTIEVDLAASQAKIARAHVPAGAFATWKWNGRRIDRLPTNKITGWAGAIEPPNEGCFVQFTGPAQPSGASLVATYACADGTKRIASFMTGLVDP